MLTPDEQERARKTAAELIDLHPSACSYSTVIVARALLEAEAELAAAKADLGSLCCELATILGAGTAPSGVTRVAYWIGRVGEAIGKVESERDSARAEVERLRALVEEAYLNGFGECAEVRTIARGRLHWERSDAKKALEVTT